MGKQFSTARGDHVEYALWLVFDKYGNVRMTRGEPALARSERALSLLTRLPTSVFSLPTLSGTITIEDTSDGQRVDLDIRAAQHALKEALGVDIDMRVVTPPEGN